MSTFWALELPLSCTTTPCSRRASQIHYFTPTTFALLPALTFVVPSFAEKSSKPTDAPKQFAVIRGDEITSLALEKFQKWAKTSKSPCLVVFSSDMTQDDERIDARNCGFLMTSPPTSIGGNASRFLFKRETQTAFLTNTELSVSVAVVGRDLTDFAKLTAKTMTLDTKNSQLKMVDSVTSIDFAERKCPVPPYWRIQWATINGANLARESTLDEWHENFCHRTKNETSRKTTV